MKMKLFLFRENIDYVGDNVYIVAANDVDEAKKYCDAGKHWTIDSTSQLSNTSQYDSPTLVWTNC